MGDGVGFSGESQLRGFEYSDELGDGVGFKGTGPEEHFVEDHPQGPNISLGCVDLSSEHLWRHVDGRPQHSRSHVPLPQQVLAKSKVSQLQDTVVEEDVVGLQVPMHDVELVENLERLHQLGKDSQRLLLPELSLLLQLAVESLAIAELVNEVEVVGGFEHLDKLDDVGALLDPGEVPDLIGRAFLEAGVLLELLDGDDLDGILLLSEVVDPLVDLAEAALAQGVQEGVVLDHFPLHGSTEEGLPDIYY